MYFPTYLPLLFPISTVLLNCIFVKLYNNAIPQKHHKNTTKLKSKYCLVGLPRPFSLSEALSDSLMPSITVVSSSVRRRRERLRRLMFIWDSLASVSAVWSVSVLSSRLYGFASGSFRTDKKRNGTPVHNSQFVGSFMFELQAAHYTSFINYNLHYKQ